MVYLDGELVEESKISAEKHTFIGTFRSPSPPRSDESWDVYACKCGHNLWTVEELFFHWKDGHMDIPQYISIKKKGE